MKDAFTTSELDRILEGFRVFVFTSADKLETVFQEELSHVYFDLSGKVVQSVAIEGTNHPAGPFYLRLKSLLFQISLHHL